MRRWQVATLLLLFVGYSGYYLCRSNLSVTKKLLTNDMVERGMSESNATDMVAALFTWGTFAYAIGKFGLGAAGDFLGGRRNFLGGMGGAVLFTVLFALGGGFPVFFCAWVANRLVQAGGWPGMVKIAGRWFDFRSQGTAMGILSLSYLFGDAIARAFMGLLMDLGLSWRGVFLVDAAILAAIWVTCFVFLKESPSAIGAPEGRASPASLYTGTEPLGLVALLLPLLRSRAFWCVCVLSLALTFMRETFNNWTPTYFTDTAGFSPGRAAYVSAAFSFLGGCSVLLAGWLNDQLGRIGRGIILFSGLLLTGLFLALLTQISPAESPAAAAGIVLTIALTLLGPYSYLAGAVALDFGGKQGGATASGFIDGVGYLGGMVAGTGVVAIVRAQGWPMAWGVLAAVSLVSCFAAALYWVDQARLAAKQPHAEGFYERG
jgi:OPA family glycerol-3-phosphate transporter-like MFS transporter